MEYDFGTVAIRMSRKPGDLSPCEAHDAKVEHCGLPTCAAWLSTPAHEHDGESWLYGFWSGINQPASKINKINIGPKSNVDLMIDEMRTFCKREPSSALVAVALRGVEMSRAGMFDGRPPK